MASPRLVPPVTVGMLQGQLGNDLVPVDTTEFMSDIVDQDMLSCGFLTMLDEMKAHYRENNWESCVDCCGILLDITWEHLNTGHWKDIHITWRHTYTVLSWIKALCQLALLRSEQITDEDRPRRLKEAVKTCDMGLLMGAPVKQNILTRLVSKLQKFYTEIDQSKHSRSCADNALSNPPSKKQKTSVPLVQSEKAVTVLQNPSLEHFRDKYMMSETPVIIEEALGYWPAMSDRKWSLQYIKGIAGCRTVPIEIGSKYTEDEWSQSLMTVEDFIENYIEKPRQDAGKGYLAQHQLFDQVPELQKDISIPSYCGLGEDDDVDINAWFGPEGTVSPLHQDPRHNLLCQVVGEKYIRLYSTEHTGSVYPHDTPMFSNTSQVDVEHPDLVKFPDFQHAPYTECILKEGQMLYIPKKYWHYVRSLVVSFSVSFWWG